MDPQELTGLPLHAVQHPFVYDGDFKVRVHGFRGLHQQQSMHARMDCKELHRHVTSGTSPTGQEESDGPFYASQLVHYGLPIDRLQPRAIKTLKDIFKTRNGAPTLHVPDTIRIIERKLKKEFEALVSRHSLSRQLQENQEEAKVLQTKLAHLRTTFQTQEQEILAKLKSLEALSIKYTTQLTAVDESRKALNEEVKDESDTEAQDSRVDVSLAECSISNKRKHQERNQTPTGNQSPAKGYPKRTRIGTPYAPPARREIDISPASEVPGRHKRWQIAPHANTNQYTTPINRSQTARQQAATTYRRDSNPPSAHTRDENRRRELLKHTSGTWQITQQNGQIATRSSEFSLSIGKIFQGENRYHQQSSSQYIKRHILSFTFGTLVGYGCSVANAELVNDRLKIVFSWKAVQEISGPNAATTLDKRRIELIFDRYSLEGYLYGSSAFEEGYVFYGTYSAQLSPTQLPEKWQEAYDACKK